ncbi:mitogen-activated protein kinase kinase kinase 17-like [Argentina anserina]|uniref:mitogen-activated protein kinase kinase kinase 17-like n=1 Tax=Argentina anserina TaxID=57926 RepID=UPI0021761F14|nr:mitogen-activated protein kinase kinase kinase 17-like [Potentilla anserina]
MGVSVGEWIFGDLIGKGGFGSVYRGYPLKYDNGSPPIMAVKVAEASDPSKVDALLDEAKLLSLFDDCPFVINSYGHEWTCKPPHNSISLTLLLEFAAGGTIRDRIESGRLSDSEIKLFTKSLLSGLHCIHDKGFVHCDIKPDNILLVIDVTSPVNFVAKIADFGLTKGAQYLHSCQGTARYLPPETLLRNIQGKPSDIWAVGCVVLEMLTGNLWTCKTSGDLDTWASNPIIPSHLSDDAKDFLAKCLDIDASKRPTAEELLTHPFLKTMPSVEQVVSVPTLSQSQHCEHMLPSFIPLGDSSSQESQKSREGSGLLGDSIFPLALMLRPARPVVADTWCREQTNFAVMGAA